MADKSRMRVYNKNEFSSAVDEALSYFKHSSLKSEEKECRKRTICPREDLLVVPPANLHWFLKFGVAELSL